MHGLAMLKKAASLVALVLAVSYAACAQDGSQPVTSEKLFAMMNQLRATSGLPALKEDTRLNDAAQMHLLEFVKAKQVSDQFEGEPSLTERLRMQSAAFGTAGELMLMAADLDHAPEQLLGNDTAKNVLLNPKYSLAGFAAVQNGSQLFIVGNLIQPLTALSVDAIEDLIVAGVQKGRSSRNIVPLNIAPIRRLRGAACDMAKKDSLKIKAMNPYGDYIGAPANKASTFTFTTADPSVLPESIQNLGAEPKINTLSVGACYATSATYPGGVYWVVLMFYGR